MVTKRKKLDGRKKILICAAFSFREKSFLSTSIDDIASTLKINKAMIYYYFKSKRLLLYEILSLSVEEGIREAELIVASNISPIEKMELLIKQQIRAETKFNSVAGIAQFELKNLPRNLRKSYIAKRDKYEQIFRDVLREGMVMGQFQKDDINVSTRFILGLLNSIPTWFRKNGSLSPGEIGEKTWKFIARCIQIGLGAERE